jgi:predicted ArsR family transcriptional regulator
VGSCGRNGRYANRLLGSSSPELTLATNYPFAQTSFERNCPFLNVARAHPAICSVSVNTLERLLGFRVIREQRFQAGDGRCVFRVQLDQPRSPGKDFTLEP